MVGFIKWTFIILLIVAGGYLWSFFSSLNADQSHALKKGATEVLNGESVGALTAPVAHMIGADLMAKRDQMLQAIRRRAQKTISDMLNGDEESGSAEPGGLH